MGGTKGAVLVTLFVFGMIGAAVVTVVGAVAIVTIPVAHTVGVVIEDCCGFGAPACLTLISQESRS